jgi:hypothetical protein
MRFDDCDDSWGAPSGPVSGGFVSFIVNLSIYSHSADPVPRGNYKKALEL